MGFSNHIPLPDGRSVEMRLMYLSEKEQLIALDNDLEFQALPLAARMRRVVDIMTPGVISLSWDGTLADMPENWIFQLAREWATGFQDWDGVTLPEANGTGSETRSPARVSPCRATPRKRRSRSRSRNGGTSLTGRHGSASHPGS